MPDIRVKLPDGRVVSFPDGTSTDQITAALKTAPPVGGGAPPPSAAPPDAPESAVSRAATQFYEKSPLSTAVNTAAGAVNVIKHPLDTFFGLVPLANVAKEAAMAQWDQAVQAAQKAKEAVHGPTPGLSAAEAFGHGLAAILPLLGPASANVGEHFAQGDTAGGVGGSLGLLAPFAAKYGIEAKRAGSAVPTNAKLAAADATKADLLRRDANQIVSQQVLAPGNPRYKGVAAKIAPEVLDRKLQGSRIELQRLADEGMSDASGRIDAAIQSNASPIAKAPLIQALDDRIAEFKVNGSVIPTAAGRVDALTALRDYLNKFPNAIPFDDLRRIRDEFYETADKAKGYQMSGNEKIADTAWAAREAGSAIRQTFGQSRPELLAPNADYTFFKRLNDVLDPALGRPKQTNYVPSGVTGGMTTAGAIIGEGMSNVPGLKALGALVGSQVLPKLKAALASPQWKLADAAKKSALADAITKGQPMVVENLLWQISKLGPRMAATPAAMATAGATPDNKPPRGR